MLIYRQLISKEQAEELFPRTVGSESLAQPVSFNDLFDENIVKPLMRNFNRRRIMLSDGTWFEEVVG